MFSFSFGEFSHVFDEFHIGLAAFAVSLLMVVLYLMIRLGSARARQESAVLAASVDFQTQKQKSQSIQDMFDLSQRQWEADKQELMSRLSQLAIYREQAEEMGRKLAAIEATQSERQQSHEKERAALLALKQDVQAQFQSLADNALRQSQSQFLEIAESQMKKHKDVTQADFERLMAPVKQSFTDFRQKIEAIEKVRHEDRSSLQTEIEKLSRAMHDTQMATGKLATALATPKSGGRWGEETLRNVLEMAGLSGHVDFTEQVHVNGENGNLRPDVVVRMPGGRHLVIDSKVSIDDFLKANDEADPARQTELLKSHARLMRQHVNTLGQKAYWANLPDTVDFVAMFVPGENFYAAALSVDRDLFEYATRNKVIIVTPSTLIALAKAVAYGWRQETAAQNAAEVTDLARELYARIATLGDKVVRVGKGLNGASTAYNELVGSLESSVLPQARKFEDLGVGGNGKDLPELPQIDEMVREPRAGRDLKFSGSKAS